MNSHYAETKTELGLSDEGAPDRRRGRSADQCRRTQLINALRAHLAEFGLVAEKGREGLAELSAIIADEMNREALPSAMKQALQTIVDQLAALELQIGTLDRATN